MEIKEYIRDYYEENKDDLEISLYQPLFDLINRDRPKTNGESVDFENFSVLELSYDYIMIAAGGDSQEPVKFEMVLLDGAIKTNIIDSSFEDGMEDITFLSELFNVRNSVYDEWEDLANNLFDKINL